MRVLFLLLSLMFWNGHAFAEDGENVEAEVEYLEMKPKFTINLATPKKYMVINAQLLVEGDKHIEKITKHMPLLRHELIMLYTSQRVEDLATMEQREKLRKKSKQVLIDALDQFDNSDGFRDIYFTELLIQ